MPKYTKMDYEIVLELRKKGLGYSEINKITRVKLTTLRHWINDGYKPWGVHTKTELDNIKQRHRVLMLGDRNPRWNPNTSIQGRGRIMARKLYKCPLLKWLKLERHHIDGNPNNNSPDNITWLSRKEHMTEDGRINRASEFSYMRKIFKRGE